MIITELIKNIDKELKKATREAAIESLSIAEEVNVIFDEKMDQIIKAGEFVFKDKLYEIKERPQSWRIYL